MKKIILGTTVILSFLIADQSTAQELKYGFKAGFNASRVRAPKRADISETSQIGSFNTQAYLDIPLSEGFAFQAGLGVSGKGANILVGNKLNATWTQYRCNPIYLELPVNAVAKIQLGDIFDECHIILGGGPYVAMGISGKVNEEGKTLGINQSSDYNMAFTNADKPVNSQNFYGKFKNFDFGLNALAGIEYHKLTFNVNYGYGLVNVNPGANLSPIDRVKNRVWSASVGVRF